MHENINRECAARAWNGTLSQFLGTVNIVINIGKAIKEIGEIQKEEFKFKLRNDKSQVIHKIYLTK